MEKFTVVVTEPIHQAGIDYLEEKGVEVISLPPGSDINALEEVAPRADGFITRGSIKVTREIMASSPRLKAVGVHGIGCDHVDLEAAKELGKVVLNTPTALTETVAEMAIALMLSMTRRIVSADKAVRAGEWSRKYGDLKGIEVMGKTVGLIGLGKIGTATARRLKPFGVDLVYYSRTRKEGVEEELGMEWMSLEQLLKRSDIISLHVPHNPETYHMLSSAEFEMMKDGVYIVNSARGKIIDQAVLVEALKSGKVAGAALDVFEVEPLPQGDPLASMDNVILAPHLGASSQEAMWRMATQVADGVFKVLNGERPDFPVVI